MELEALRQSGSATHSGRRADRWKLFRGNACTTPVSRSTSRARRAASSPQRRPAKAAKIPVSETEVASAQIAATPDLLTLPAAPMSALCRTLASGRDSPRSNRSSLTAVFKIARSSGMTRSVASLPSATRNQVPVAPWSMTASSSPQQPQPGEGQPVVEFVDEHGMVIVRRPVNPGPVPTRYRYRLNAHSPLQRKDQTMRSGAVGNLVEVRNNLPISTGQIFRDVSKFVLRS
jgi:hypothetical protein